MRVRRDNSAREIPNSLVAQKHKRLRAYTLLRSLPGVVRRKSVRAEIIDFLTCSCHVFIHDEDANETDFEHAFWVFQDDRSGSGKSCASPASGHYETVCQTTATSKPGSSILDLAFSILEKLAGAIDRCQTRNGHSLASRGFQTVLEIQVSTQRLWATSDQP